MSEVVRRRVSQPLVVLSGLISAALTLWGGLVSMMFDYRVPADLSLGIAFVLPLFCFLVSLWWWGLSTALLLLDFGGLAYVRGVMLSNPQRNPFDSLGLLFLCPGILMLAAYLLAPMDRSRRIGLLWIISGI